MEDMGLKLTPVVVRHPLHPLGLFRPTALWLVLLGLIAIPNSPNRGISHLQLLTLPHHPPHPLQCTISDITVTVKKLLKIQQC